MRRATPRRRGSVVARTLTLVLMLWLAGCAAAPSPAVPATRTLDAPPVAVLEATLSLLMERGYVIRHADAGLGRLEAVIARWPGYRVRLEVEAADAAGDGAGGSRLAMTAWRGERPLPPRLVEPLLDALNGRLASRP